MKENSILVGMGCLRVRYMEDDLVLIWRVGGIKMIEVVEENKA